MIPVYITHAEKHIHFIRKKAFMPYETLQNLYKSLDMGQLWNLAEREATKIIKWDSKKYDGPLRYACLAMG
jgi:hypothetical protein